MGTSPFRLGRTRPVDRLDCNFKVGMGDIDSIKGTILQREAFAEALKKLFDEHAPHDPFHSHMRIGPQVSRERALVASNASSMLHFACDTGAPNDQLVALFSLIFLT